MTGLELLDEQLIAKIRGIQMRAKYLVNNAFAGEYKSAFKGRGLEFEEVREYQWGDDIRSIDWNVTARTGFPHIKLHQDERELMVMFLVDVSASSHFGTKEKFKNEVLAEVTALLAYTALRNNDKVGLIIFSDQVEHYLPPKKGRGHVWQLIRDILSYQSSSRQTRLDVPLEFLNRVLKKRAIVFMLSDFQAQGFETIMRTTARRHDLVSISVEDPHEISLPQVGYIDLEDAETGESLLVKTSSHNIQEYEKTNRRHKKHLREFFRSSEIDFIELKTDTPYLDSIIRFFRGREKIV